MASGCQIQTAGLALVVKDDSQKMAYFLRDLPLDDFRRFFSCEVNASLDRPRSTDLSADVDEVTNQWSGSDR